MQRNATPQPLLCEVLDALDDLLSAGEALTRRLLGTSSGESPRWQPDEEPTDGPNGGSYHPMHDPAAVVIRQCASFGWATDGAAPLSAQPAPEPSADSPEPV
ncbi:hypothetical protein [Cryobacterium ruanii]|uniref:Uncharacterized protein n=1 Tax=Cryobacterium ruanii TaxID=1259197 RepID=A0A4R9AR71_9MICO|nr:hypothetical protein [Cryobacterium ruanii]TFD68069.1 hypothetical protein E3T47_05685 [Cryobacterium ruanii]